jgi:hypothetical protein
MKGLGEGLGRGGEAAPFSHGAGIAQGEAASSRTVRSSPVLALSDRLKFPNIFVPENERTFVHLAKAIQEYRNIDFLIFILVFEWLEAAMEKGVFYAVN